MLTTTCRALLFQPFTPQKLNQHPPAVCTRSITAEYKKDGKAKGVKLVITGNAGAKVRGFSPYLPSRHYWRDLALMPCS